MKTGNQPVTGSVLDIQRMSTEDGPGLRTTVFLKGCSLKCTWCHNPESIESGVQIRWSASACIGCRTCTDVCDAGALRLDEDGLHIDRQRCTRCGTCTDECPAMAVSTTGTRWTADDLVSELVKDKAFFDTSGGGITLSGGEVTLQADFCREVLRQLETRHIHTAIDTCGQCSKAALEKLLPHTGMVLFDLKEMDPDRHRRFTGHTNEIILENARFAADWLVNHDRLSSLWIRTPIIPDATLDETNIRSMGNFISRQLGKAVARWDLCTFNNLCRDKYEALGLSWKHSGTRLVKIDEIEHLAAVAKASGVAPEIVHWSGSTQQTD